MTTQFKTADGNHPPVAPHEASIKIPLIEESVQVETEEVETGVVRLTKVVEREEMPVELSLASSQVEVQRIPVNHYVDKTFGPRQEGDTIIVPVFEEIIIKQLVLKEEVHIRVKEETHEIHERLAVRGEKVFVERYDAITKEWKAESGS